MTDGMSSVKPKDLQPSGARAGAGGAGLRPRRFGAAVKSGAGIAGLLALVLALAGRLNYHQGWLFIGTNALMVTLLVTFVPELPSLMKERTRPGPATKWWDRIFWGLFGPLNLAVFLLASLDGGRYLWTGRLHPAISVAAALAYLAAGALHFWAIRVNPFYTSTVSVQANSGQIAVSEGPYRYVRHPGYAGIIVMMFSLPLILGSLWALVPAAGIFLLVIVRTALEDAVLRSELPGYTRYAAEVRFRLVPGIW